MHLTLTTVRTRAWQSPYRRSLEEGEPVPIDQAKLGKHIQEQMEAIERDPGISENAQIGDIVTVVEIIDPGEGDAPEPGTEVEVSRSVRVRQTGMPHVGIGLLEEAKNNLFQMSRGS
jgi:hypothetical protein